MIILEDICKEYSRPIFENLNLTIEDGEFLLLCGPSGSGKSTLLNLIGMLDNDYSGGLEINGIANPNINKRSGQKLLKSEISYLFQNYGLIDNQSIYQNLKIIDRTKRLKSDDKYELFESTLLKLGLEMDLDTMIYELSGGEQQRVAIAKIMLKEPKIILCDEPTGSLDEENAIAIMEILKALNESGSTIVMASHDELVKKYCTRVFEVENYK